MRQALTRSSVSGRSYSSNRDVAAIAVHSNSELCLQHAFRAAMTSARYASPRALDSIWAPRHASAIPSTNETIQVSDDVIEGGQFDFSGGHLKIVVSRFLLHSERRAGGGPPTAQEL